MSHKEQVCQSSLLLGRNVRWPRLLLPPGESRLLCRLDRQTDGHTADHYIMLSARLGKCKNVFACQLSAGRTRCDFILQ